MLIFFFFGPTCGVVATVRRGNYRFWDHSSSCTGVTIHYPTGEALSDESKCYPSNCGCEGGEQPDNNGCLPLAFGTEPGENQSGEMWLIPPDRMTPMVHYLQNLFSRLRRNLGKFFFPPANSVISGAKWDDIVYVAVWINLAESKTACGQIFISCFWFSGMERLTASSRQTRNQDIAETQPRVWVPTRAQPQQNLQRELLHEAPKMYSC